MGEQVMQVLNGFVITHPLMAALFLFIFIPAVLVWIAHTITEKGT